MRRRAPLPEFPRRAWERGKTGIFRARRDNYLTIPSRICVHPPRFVFEGFRMKKDLPILLLCSTGRAGSSIAMRILGAHEEILTRYMFPYETRAAQYYYARSLAEQEEKLFTPVKYKGATYGPFQGGDALSKQWTGDMENKLSGDFSAEYLTSVYYNQVAKLEGKSNFSCVAEKTIGTDLGVLMMQSNGSYRMLILTRDPRDVFCSVKAFNKKRGFIDFGENLGDERLFSNMVNFLKRAEEIERTFRGRTSRLRYEDMVTNPCETFAKVFKWLGVRSDPDYVESIVRGAFRDDENTSNHRTSADINESIGRWRKECDFDTKALFATKQALLDRYGYHSDRAGDGLSNFPGRSRGDSEKPTVPDQPASLVKGAINGPVLQHVLHGWAYLPEGTLRVKIKIDGKSIEGDVIANISRSDLKKSGFGDGRCGFRVAIPIVFADDMEHLVELLAIVDEKEVLVSEKRIFLPRIKEDRTGS
jgi:hypothetical protein